MWQAAKPTLQMIEFMEAGGIDNIPVDLVRHTQVDSFLIQRAKFRYCLFASFINTLFILLTTFIRIVITFDTYEKEEKILLSM